MVTQVSSGIASAIYLCGCCGNVQKRRSSVEYKQVIGKAHYKKYADDCAKRFDSSFVVEIGSTDGMHSLFSGKTLVIDPYAAHGIAELPDIDTARMVVAKHGHPTMIIANDAFAFSEDIGEMMDAVKLMLSENGVFIFEVPYLHDFLDGKQDYAAHSPNVFLHSVNPLIPFFDRHGLELFSVQHNDNSGGSIRGFVQHKTGNNNQKWYLMTFENGTIRDTRAKFMNFRNERVACA